MINSWYLVGQDVSLSDVEEETSDLLEDFMNTSRGHAPVFAPLEDAQKLIETIRLPGYQPKFLTSPNQLLRALEALLVSHKAALNHYKNDNCQLVQAAFALNPLSEQLQLGIGQEDYAFPPEGITCGCISGLTAMNSYFTFLGINAPKQLPKNLELKQLGNNAWGTQERPGSLQDYLFYEVAEEYLAGPVPDHYSISYDGHGINSYGITVRFAWGNLAVIAQVSFGGFFENNKEAVQRWNAIIKTIDMIFGAIDVRLSNPREHGENLKPIQRTHLLRFSSFRGILESLILENGEWVVRSTHGLLEQIDSLEDETKLFEKAARDICVKAFSSTENVELSPHNKLRAGSQK